MSVVAHMDDDLLFIDPGISEAARSGACVTTIFVIGGASGAGYDFVLTRENASQHAYARMVGATSNWTVDTVDAGGMSVAHAQLAGHPNISHIYLRVPGGEVRTGNVPLAQVFDNPSANVASWPYTNIASGPTNLYTRANLINTVTALVDGFSATEVYALNPDTVPYVEHPDHIYSARLTREALKAVSTNLAVSYHDTYPTAGRVPNVSPTAAQFKRDLAATYFNYEGGQFEGTGVFGEHMYNGNWITRRYARSAMGWDTTPAFDPISAPIVNLQTQQCLTSSGLGNTPSLVRCTNGAANQQWQWVSSPVATGAWGTALLKSGSGTCMAVRGNNIVEEACSTDVAQQWQPWDFGKLFTADHRCVGASGAALTLSTCSQYAGEHLWGRSITNVDSDPNVEVALTGNVTGDGTDRLVVVHRRGDGPGINVWVTKLTADTPQTQDANWYDSKVRFDPSAITPTCTDANLCFDQTRFLLNDFDNDGKADLMAIAPNKGSTGFWFFKSTGTSFAEPVLWANTPSDMPYVLAHQYVVGDFNGDGNKDVLVAHTRGDSGLNFWIMTGNGSTALNAPVKWADATELQNSARLFPAKLDSSNRTGVMAVDSIGGLRLSTFVSTGSAFTKSIAVRQDRLFTPTRSKVMLMPSSSSGLTDVWVLHVRADGTAVNFWRMNGTQTGFNPPTLAFTSTAAAWSDIRPYAYKDTSSTQILLVHRVERPVGEYDWRIGNLAVKGYPVSTTGIVGPMANYGASPNYSWTQLAWRNRLNR